MRLRFCVHTECGLIDFLFGHSTPLSTLAPRYVFAHNAVYHKNLSDFSIKWGLSNLFMK